MGWYLLKQDIRTLSVDLQDLVKYIPELKIHIVIKINGVKVIDPNPFYTAGKDDGDARAAFELSKAIVSASKVAEMSKRFPGAILVAVYAVEESGKNAIPSALANRMSELGGFRVEDSITQTNVVKHTGSNAFHRLSAVPEFTGDVTPGAQYIIVDDVTTSGSTLAGLRNYIESNGGDVVAASTAGTTMTPQTGYGGFLAIRPYTIAKLKKFDTGALNDILSQYGIAPSIKHLTNSQGNYLATFASLDTLRNRLATTEQAGAGGGTSSALGAGSSQVGFLKQV